MGLDTKKWGLDIVWDWIGIWYGIELGLGMGFSLGFGMGFGMKFSMGFSMGLGTFFFVCSSRSRLRLSTLRGDEPI